MRKRFLEAFLYDPESGLLKWRIRPSNRVKIGATAGCHSGNGYLKVRLDGVLHYVHRVVYLMANGDIPRGKEIDHVNGNGSDNRLHNLRLVDSLGNKRNQKLRSTNKSGVMGVFWREKDKKWQVAIGLSWGQKYLGLYRDYDEAVAARKAAEAELNFHQNHGRGKGS